MSDQNSRRVDGRALRKAIGLLWAGAVVVLGVTAGYGWGDEWRDPLSDVSVGNDSTKRGLVFGAIWAFFDAFVGASLLAWLCNLFR